MPPDPEPSEPRTFSRTAEDLIASLRRLPLDDNPRARRRPTRPLSGLVEDLVVKHSIGRHSPEQEIREHWADHVRDFIGAAVDDGNQPRHSRRLDFGQTAFAVDHFDHLVSDGSSILGGFSKSRQSVA